MNKKKPAPSFEDLLKRKMEDKGLSLADAIRDIIRSASTTNPNVDEFFGLGGKNK